MYKEREERLRELAKSPVLGSDVRAALDIIDKLKAALEGTLGVSKKEELEAMEANLRALPAPMADKEAALNAIHVLLELAR